MLPAGRLRVNDRERSDSDARQRHDEHGPSVGIGLQEASQPPDPGTDQGGGQSDRHRPAELGHGGLAETGKAGKGQRERAQPGQVVQADEDERAGSRRQQARQQHQPGIGPPSPDASSSRNAPVMGDPSSVAMAAKLPALASTLTPWAGTWRRGWPARPGGRRWRSAASRGRARHRRPGLPAPRR